MFAALVEVEVGTGEKISDGSGDEDLARSGERRDALSGVDRDSRDVVTAEFDLTGVEPGSHFNTESMDTVADRARTLDRACRAVEGREDTVAGELYEPAPETLQLFADERIMGHEYFAPTPVS